MGRVSSQWRSWPRWSRGDKEDITHGCRIGASWEPVPPQGFTLACSSGKAQVRPRQQMGSGIATSTTPTLTARMSYLIMQGV